MEFGSLLTMRLKEVVLTLKPEQASQVLRICLDQDQVEALKFLNERPSKRIKDALKDIGEFPYLKPVMVPSRSLLNFLRNAPALFFPRDEKI